jgi:Fe-S-cluster-containing hydrogenase component 2
MVGCPVGAIRRKGSLEVIIEDWCIGCGACAKGCPYGNINIQEFPGVAANGISGPVTKANVVHKATSCNLCHDFPEPSCVYACPHDAAIRVSPNKFFSEMLSQERPDES